ncbi:MAG TPA: glycosyltransferase family 1 protein, partial [Hymenobacter sp.]
NYKLFSRGKRFLRRKIGLEEINEFAKLPKEVSSIFSESRFDVFHPTYYNPYFLEFTTKPFVLTVHDMIHEIYKEYFPLLDSTSRDKQLLCNKANQIVTVSNKTKEDLLDIFKLPEDNIHTIPLASSFADVLPSRPKNAERLEHYILFVGNRSNYKNFYYATTALADLLKSDKQLNILCTGVPFKKQELQFFKDLGIQGQMQHIYLKDDNELAWVYRNADLFIFPSLYEGFGFPLLEAFASECPVISSSGGSLPEVGGDAALYFEPKKIKEIQDAASAVLYNPEVRNKLIERGKERYKQFSWEKFRSETKKVYELVDK